MLLAVLADLAKLPDVEPLTTWHEALGNFPLPNVTAVRVSGPAEEAHAFDELCGLAGGTLVIAPEFDGHLEARSRRVLACGGRLLGCTPEAISLAGDKLRLAETWLQRGLPTLPTWGICGRELTQCPTPPVEFPLVIKPRYGAGSQATHVIRDRRQWQDLVPALSREPLLATAVVQPFQSGIPASCAVFCDAETATAIPLPLTRQQISTEGRLRYLGGRLTWPSPENHAVGELVREACQAVPGLRGYIGIDLLLTESGNAAQLVELNPRLTTSYLGYRALVCEQPIENRDPGAGHPLAACLMTPNQARELTWQSVQLRFDPDGTIHRLTAKQ